MSIHRIGWLLLGLVCAFGIGVLIGAALGMVHRGPLAVS